MSGLSLRVMMVRVASSLDLGFESFEFAEALPAIVEARQRLLVEAARRIR